LTIARYSKTIVAGGAGAGDTIVGLWIAEAARAKGEQILFVDEGRAPIVRAFGHETAQLASKDCMRLGSGSPTYDAEIRTAGRDKSPRVERWQKTLNWNFGWLRPRLRPLPEEAVEWARHMTEGRPTVVIAPMAMHGPRNLPLQKWVRLAWSLKADGIRSVAIDAHKSNVDTFPLFAHGFGWDNVMALLSLATVVAGNDSGIAHLAATIGIPTVVAMGPTDANIVFGHCLDVVTPLSIDLPCIACHFQGRRGFQAACDKGCEALHMLPWQAVKAAVLEKMAQERGVLAMAHA
jgi:hypothetical protein